MVRPSALADTVTPPIASPEGDLIAPLSTTSAATHGEIQAANEIASAPATTRKPCAFLMASLPVRRARRDAIVREPRCFFQLNRLCRGEGRPAHAGRASE